MIYKYFVRRGGGVSDLYDCPREKFSTRTLRGEEVVVLGTNKVRFDKNISNLLLQSDQG